MSEQIRDLMCFDVSKSFYLPVVKEAGGEAWRVMPYDIERYAREDLEDLHNPALVVVLNNKDSLMSFEGGSLLELADSIHVLSAVIAVPEHEEAVRQTRIDKFIPKNSKSITEELASWLTSLQAS